MIKIRSAIQWASSLKTAILLLLLIAISSTIGTAIPQKEIHDFYIDKYQNSRWLGFINGKYLLLLQLDHLYTSYWFLFLLFWLGFALIICSWRRQFPIIKSALKWIEYKDPQQIRKLAIAETIDFECEEDSLIKINSALKKQGWNLKEYSQRFAARKGVIGRIGPPLIHLGLILLMIGSTWGALYGQKVEKFLAPERSFDLVNNEGEKQITFKLKNFLIERDSAGRPEQFKSIVQIINESEKTMLNKEVSVNHPIRFRGLTLYQADWSLAAINLQINGSPILQLPLKSYPELGEQVWGVVIPTTNNLEMPILLTTSNENGPISIYSPDGELLSTIKPFSTPKQINDIKIKALDVIPASGLLLKRDPGVPIVYAGFAVALIGGFLSIISTQQLWIILDIKNSLLHIGGLSNRNPTGLARNLPKLIDEIKS